ncbi:ASCH domain-containing protein [Variovorax sp. Varisp41]|uniref:ASCH domain-containing protein n=1 Tax=Variovorax sp. Varisp41 TaxID=3243033 RepID=UPI0039B3AD6E
MAPPEVVSKEPFPPVPTGMLHLPLKREYFEQIRDGKKRFEYRLRTPYWCRRLEGRFYSGIVLTMGYPAADDTARRLDLPFRGYELDTITHEHFGPAAVDVFAIRVWP